MQIEDQTYSKESADDTNKNIELNYFVMKKMHWDLKFHLIQAINTNIKVCIFLQKMHLLLKHH